MTDSVREWTQTPVFARFERIALAQPAAVAVRDDGGVLTYGEVLHRARAVASALTGALTGAAPAQMAVAVAVAHDRRFPCAMLGALGAGCPYVPLDLSFPAERVLFVLRHSAARLVLTDASTHGRVQEWLPEGVACLNVDELPPAGPGWVSVARPDAVAYVLYTSGSTGQPKGVFQSQAGLAHDVWQYTAAAGIGAGDVLSAMYSPSVNGALRDIYGALLNGAQLAVIDLKRMGFGATLAALASWHVTVLHAMPPVIRALLRQWPEGLRLPDLRLVYTAGDRLYAADVAQVRGALGQVAIYNGIGSTECATLYCHWFVDDALLAGNGVPVGRPIEARRVELLGEGGKAVLAGEPGEVVVESRFVAGGYWNEPELTRRCFLPGVHDPLARRFKTGDLARVRADGLLEFLGRVDRQVKIRGYRVDPSEAEAVVRSVRGILNAAVVVRWADGQPVLAAFAEADGAWLHQDAARAVWLALESSLPAHLRPATLVMVDALPMLGNFKVDYQALERLANDAANVWRSIDVANAESVSPAQPSGHALDGALFDEVGRVWRAVLKCQPGHEGATFEALNGDSLLALELHLAIERVLGEEVSTEWFSPQVTLPQLISSLQARRGKPDGGALRRQVLLFPPARGVCMLTLALRDVLARFFEVVLMDYGLGNEAGTGDTPDAADMGKATRERQIVSINDLASVCLPQVLRVRREGVPQVAFGFSYGARVAHETVALCEARGVALGQLVIADVPPQERHLFVPKGWVHQCLRWVRDGVVRLDRAWPLVPDSFWLASAQSLAGGANQPRWLKQVGALLGTVITDRQIRRWVHRHVHTPTLVLVTADTLAANPDLKNTLGWEQLCGCTWSAGLDAEHTTFFRPPHHRVFVRAMTLAFPNARAQHPTTEVG